MNENITSIVCSLGIDGGKCIEITNRFTTYSKYIQAGLSIAIVVAIGITIIAIIKRKSKKKENT